MRRAAVLLAAALASSCQESGSAGPWLTYPGVDGHARWFPLAGTVHDPTAAGAAVSCESCHAGTTFTEFDCITCHTGPSTDPIHVAIGDYTHTSAGCYGCHPTGGAGAPADHDTAFFPRGPGSAHAAMACLDCHTDLANPRVAANFRCGTCHLSRDAALVTKHTASADRALRVAASEISASDSATCLRCHADAQLVGGHPTGGEGWPPHEGARCLQCHDVYRADKPFGIDFASDPAAQAKFLSSPRHGCYNCHDTYPPRD